MSKSVVEQDRESPLRLLIPFFVLSWIVIFWARFFLTVLPGVGDGVVDRVDILLAVPEILWNNLFPQRLPTDSSSWSNLAQRLPILGYALFMLAGAFAMGMLTLRAFKLDLGSDRAAQTAIVGGVGLSMLSLFTLGFGFFGLLSRSLFFGVILSAIAVAWFVSFREGRKTSARNHEPRVREASSRMVVMLCIIFLGPMLLGAMLPSTDFDVNEYHLQGPKEYFLAGRIHFLPHNVYTSFPFLTEMLSLCAMVLTEDWFNGALVGKTVLMSFAPLTALGIYSVARRVAGVPAGVAGALVYLSTPWTYRISIIAYTEGAMCCYVILSVLALIIWFEQLQRPENTESSQRAMSLLCGLLAGSAVATKYPGMALVAIPVAFFMLGTVVIRKVSWRHALAMAGMYILGGVLTFGPWVVKNSLETGNPVYPLLYSVFGGEDWDEQLNAKWKAGHARPSPLLKEPVAMVQEFKKNVIDVTLGSVWQSPLMFGLAPLAFLYRNRNWKLWIVVAAAFTILTVWYTMTHLIDRFWVPVLPVVAVLSGVGWSAIGQSFADNQTTGSTIQAWIGRVVGSVIFVTLIYNFKFMTTAACGYNAYLIDYKAARQAVKPLSILIAEQAMQADDRVLFVGEAMVFDCERQCRYNTVFDVSLLEHWTSRKLTADTWELRSSEEIAKKFDEEGITHILINWNEVLRYRTTYGYTDFVSPGRIAELAKRWPFVEVPLSDSYNLKDWELIDESWKREIEQWGPELKQTLPNGNVGMRQYQLFELSDENGRG